MKKMFVILALLSLFMTNVFAAEKCSRSFSTNIGNVLWYETDAPIDGNWKYITEYVGQADASKCMVVSISTSNGKSDSDIGCKSGVDARVTDTIGVSHSHNHYIDYNYSRIMRDQNK